MTGRTRGILGIIVILIIFLTGAFLLTRKPPSIAPSTLTVAGVVLADDRDPKNQVPLPDAKISIVTSNQRKQIGTDASGSFHSTFLLPPGPHSISLTFQAAGHRVLTITKLLDDRLVIARLLPEARETPNTDQRTTTTITKEGVSVRYTTKMTTAVNVGPFATTFEVTNIGNVPCGESQVCSPDGRWKATVTPVVFEALTGNRFLNARVSCIAGPCRFTRIEDNNLSDPGSAIRMSVRNWSDTTTFLVEAERSRVINGEMVRQSFPAIFGPALSFTLPPGAVGPSIEAEVNGTRIVYPLGPEHKLSWATCTVEAAKSGTQLFRCELKPGYEFR